jgi:membrane protease YdiL (CAAX protease family)
MALTHFAAFLGLTLVSYVLLTIVAMVALFATVSLIDMSDPDAIVEALGPGGNGALALGLHLTLFVSALALSLTLPLDKAAALHLPRSLRDVRVKLGESLAIRRGQWAYAVPAVLGALTIGLAASWLSERVMEWLPDYPNNLEIISGLLSDGTGLGWGVLVIAVVLSAPVFEEVAFRCYLWSVVERTGSRFLLFAASFGFVLGILMILVAGWFGTRDLITASVLLGWTAACGVCILGTAARPAWTGWTWVAPWILTSLLFMAYHQDPIHVLGLTPTAFFLGWLRMMSGSIWIPILAHFVNNALAVTLSLLLTGDTDIAVTFPMALAALSFTATVSGVTWAIVRPKTVET